MEAAELAGGEASRTTAAGLRAEALRDVLNAFRGVTFPGREYFRGWAADEFEMAEAILADRPWAEIDPLNQPLYLPDSGVTDMIQPYAPLLAIASLMPEQPADPRQIGLAASLLKDHGLFGQLSAEQFQAVAKAAVAQSVLGEEAARLDAWLYLCAVKMEALHISRRTAVSNTVENLMNMHIAAALSVEKTPEAARLSAWWIQAMRVLDDRSGLLLKDDLTALLQHRKEAITAGTWSLMPMWLLDQIEFLVGAARVSGRFDDLSSFWSAELAPSAAAAPLA